MPKTCFICLLIGSPAHLNHCPLGDQCSHSPVLYSVLVSRRRDPLFPRFSSKLLLFILQSSMLVLSHLLCHSKYTARFQPVSIPLPQIVFKWVFDWHAKGFQPRKSANHVQATTRSHCYMTSIN